MNNRYLILVIILAIVFVFFGQRAFTADSTGNGNNRILWTQNFPGMVYDCAFMPDENYIIDAHDTLLEIRRTIDDSLIKAKSFNAILYSFDLSKDGKYVALGGGSLKLIELNTFDVIKDFQTKATKSISFSPDGKEIAFVSASSNKFGAGWYFANVLDVETGKLLFKLGQDSAYDPMMAFAKFSPDGKWLACAYDGLDHNVYVFDTDSFKIWTVFNQDDKTNSTIENLLFSPKSQYLLAEGAIGTYGCGSRMWDLNKKQEIFLKDIPCENPLIIFSDNETILCGGFPDESYFYDFKNYKSVSLGIRPRIYEGVLNKDESLVLGLGFQLLQIDKSILSVPKEKPIDEKEIIYPNPSTGDVTLKINFPSAYAATINLLDVSGHQISNLMNQFVSKGSFEFNYNTSYLPAGIYFFQVTQKSFSKTFKLVKEG